MIERSIIGFGARIGPRALIRDGVIGDGADIGARCELLSGAQVWPVSFFPTAGSVTRPTFELLAPRSTSLAGHARRSPAAVIAEIRAWSCGRGA